MPGLADVCKRCCCASAAYSTGLVGLQGEPVEPVEAVRVGKGALDGALAARNGMAARRALACCGLGALQVQQGRSPGKNGAALVYQGSTLIHEPLNAALLHKNCMGCPICLVARC